MFRLRTDRPRRLFVPLLAALIALGGLALPARAQDLNPERLLEKLLDGAKEAAREAERAAKDAMRSARDAADDLLDKATRNLPDPDDLMREAQRTAEELLREAERKLDVDFEDLLRDLQGSVPDPDDLLRDLKRNLPDPDELMRDAQRAIEEGMRKLQKFLPGGKKSKSMPMPEREWVPEREVPEPPHAVPNNSEPHAMPGEPGGESGGEGSSESEGGAGGSESGLDGVIVYLELTDYPAVEALQWICGEFRVNLVVSDDVNGKITVSVKDLTVATVIDDILKQVNAAWTKHGEIVYVYPAGKKPTITDPDLPAFREKTIQYLSFTNYAIREALLRVSGEYGFEVEIDKLARGKVTMTLENAPLLDALGAMLAATHCTATVKDGKTLVVEPAKK